MDIPFCDGWTFRKEGGSPVCIKLPHDAMLREKRDGKSAGGVNSGYFPGGKYIYEKTFTLSGEDISKSIVVSFEGVYQNAKVFLNDELITFHRYGYTPFDADFTGKVKKGENRLIVTVDNSLVPNCRWYSGSGIYRPVTLRIRERNHIEKVHIETVSINPAVINVNVMTSRKSDVSITVLDGETVIAEGKDGLMTVPDAVLWSADNPHLYRIVVSTEEDERCCLYGIRKLEWSAEKGLLVNGERVLLRGGCIHHDNGILGASEYPDAAERRIRILKEAGFNAVRAAHNPASRAVLDACDRIGMYVMNEAFDGWYIPKTYHDYSRFFSSDWKSDLEAMVESSRNHSCVIMYSTGNEVSETAEEKGVEVCREMTEYVHSLDSTRPVTAGVNVLLNVYSKMGMGVYREKGEYRAEMVEMKKGYREKKTGSAFFNALTQKLGKLMFFMAGGKRGDRATSSAAPALDIIGLNYASSRYDYDALKYPERMMVGSETLVSDLPYNWERVKKYPQLVGDFVWAAWDYIGEVCMGWTYHSYKGLPLLANQGMIDILGYETASMGFMRVVWGLRKEPYIAVRPLNHASERPSKGSWQFTDAVPSWAWPGYEHTPAVVEVYSPGEKVRLSLSGRTVAVGKLKDYKALFSVEWEKGTLRAEALDKDGNVISSSFLSSGRGGRKLRVTPSRRVLRAGTDDLSFVTVEFTDDEGLLLPAVEQSVDLETDGNISILGFGSALYKTDETFLENHHVSYRGRLLAVFGAGGKAGKTAVTFKSAGVNPVTIELEVQ